jgi:group II intron reverse transcriptase/maturase
MIPSWEVPTPNKVQALQRTLNRKAKENPRWRAWTLWGDLCRRDVLETALTAVLTNAGAAGVDRVTTEAVKADSAAFLDGLQTELKARSYRPSPVLRVWIPKADGKLRPLGIPTVKDRVVQTALVILLGPIFEADFNEYSFGYRPGRSAHQALDAIKEAIWQGRTEVVDADLSGYFDTIPHAELLQLVARRVSDGAILRLVKLFLRAPIVEEKDGKRTIRPNQSGTPQGGVISPLLANLYLNRLDHEVNGNPKLDARMVRYADDLVLLCRPGNGSEYYQRLKVYLERRGLALNEAKSRLVDVHQESVRFLGFDVRWRRSRFTGRGYVHVEPSRKAQQRLRDVVRQELNHWTRWRSCTETVRRVNRIVQGWSNYYHYGNCAKVFCRHQSWLRERFRTWLWRKYDRTLGRYTFFTRERLHGQYHLWALPQTARWTR